MELSPCMLAFGIKLHDYLINHKGGELPEEIKSYAESDSWPSDIPKLSDLLTLKAVVRMLQFRADYMVLLFIKVLGGRAEFSKLNIGDRLFKLRGEFQQVDRICGLCPPEILAAAYGAALTSVIKNGGFKVADVTECAAHIPKEVKPSDGGSATATASGCGESAGSGSGGSLISQAELSTYGINVDFHKDGNISSILKSSETLFQLRAALSRDVARVCRTDRRTD